MEDFNKAPENKMNGEYIERCFSQGDEVIHIGRLMCEYMYSMLHHLKIYLSTLYIHHTSDYFH